MQNLTSAFGYTFRDFVTDGVASSGRHEPPKMEIQALGARIDAKIAAAVASGADLAAVEDLIEPLLTAALAAAASSASSLYQLEAALAEVEDQVSEIIDDAVASATAASLAAKLAAELARDQAADLVLPENRFVAADLATARSDGEAGTTTGTYFVAVGTTEGEAEVRLRTSGGSDLIYTEITKAALASGDSGKGADLVGSKLDDSEAVPIPIGRRFNRITKVTPWDFGEITGVASNDTPLIDEAARAAFDMKKQLFFPGGIYGYDGNGIRAGRGVSYGDGNYKTIINLGAGKELFRTYHDGAEELLSSFEVHDMAVLGGGGLARSMGTEANINPLRWLSGLRVENFTRCGFETNTVDGPYITIENCSIRPATLANGGGDAISLALSGLCDHVKIHNCEFARHRVAIKLGRGGINADVSGNSFLQFEYSDDPRVDVWLVTTNGTANLGDGCRIAHNKHGNEYRDPNGQGYYIVAAQEDDASGSSFGDRLPRFDGIDSGHRIAGTIIEANGIYGLSDGVGPATPYFYSTTANTSGIYLAPSNVIAGTSPSSMLSFLNLPSSAQAKRISSRIAEPSRPTDVALLFPSGYRRPVTLTNVGTTATLDGLTSHGKRVGDKIRVVGAADAAFNGIFTLASVTTNGGTYVMGGTPSIAAGSNCWGEVENFNGVRIGQRMTAQPGMLTIPITTGAIIGPGGAVAPATNTGAEWGWIFRSDIVVRSVKFVVTSGALPSSSLVYIGRNATTTGAHTLLFTMASGAESGVTETVRFNVKAGEALSFFVSAASSEFDGHLIFEYDEVFT